MPDHGYPAHIELHLTATWDGETLTTTHRIDYRTVDVTLTADESGATVELGEHTGLAPLRHALPIGSRVTISAAETLSNELGDFSFTGWSAAVPHARDRRLARGDHAHRQLHELAPVHGDDEGATSKCTV
jgi:hypothetical protein